MEEITPVVDHAAHATKEHMLALSVVTMVMLNIISLGLGQWLHSKHIYWIPECGVTIIVGFLAGKWVGSHLPPDVEREETNLYFDPTFFQLFLLPPIIFEAGYNLNMPLFSKNMGKILSLAVFGTLISTAVTWFALYTDSTDFLIDLSFSESGQFAALISAVDPVATLALFGALKVDPGLNNIVVGESVLNDAVALIAFRAVTHYGVNMADESESIFASFMITGLGSAFMGVGMGCLSAFTFKTMGIGLRATKKRSALVDAHERHHIASDITYVECVIFFMFSYIAFVAAELPHLSGIVSSLFAGFTMRAYARPNLSADARLRVDSLLKIMSCVADNIIYLLVGFALTIELEYVFRVDLDGTTLDLVDASQAFVYVIILAVSVRAMHLFPILGMFNLFSAKENKVPFSQQIVCWFSGLRGAIAVALAYQVEGDDLGGTANNKHVIRAATMMTVVFTTFAFGGSTPCLLDCMKIPMGVEEEEEELKMTGIYKVLEDRLVDSEIKKHEDTPLKEFAPLKEEVILGA